MARCRPVTGTESPTRRQGYHFIERTGQMTRGFLRFLRGNTIALLALFLALGGTT
jgi:hypothetical protein